MCVNALLENYDTINDLDHCAIGNWLTPNRELKEITEDNVVQWKRYRSTHGIKQLKPMTF